MTNAEWIEYYRFHPSEFDNFIKFVETEFEKKEAELADSKAAEMFAANVINKLSADIAKASTAASANLRMAQEQAEKVANLKTAITAMAKAYHNVADHQSADFTTCGYKVCQIAIEALK